MAKRRVKKRTQPKAAPGGPSSKNGMTRPPKSMVIRVGAGEVGSSVSQLVKDVRSMMEPDTASRLRVGCDSFYAASFELRLIAYSHQERKGNRLKDYTVMTGPLGVTHLLLFSKSKSGNTNLRLALTPRGPTLHFRIENYSLCKDVARALKRPRGQGKNHLNPPLLVMNNFMSSDPEDLKKVPKHLESLMTTVFQSLFPPISPHTTPLSSIRRIMLVNRELSSKTDEEKGTYRLTLRHYAITTKRVDVSRRLRRLDPREQKNKDKKDRAVPNLGRLNDVADYLLDPAEGGYTSASETEIDTDAEVEVMETSARKVLSKRELQKMKESEKKPSKASSSVERRAVKLVELGPRMKLKLIKVEEGLCGGKVMWHDFISKSAAEAEQQDQEWEKKRKEKEERRRIQKENIEKKKKAKAKDGGKEDEGDEMDVDDEDEDMEDWDSEDFDDDDEVEDEE